MTFVECVLIYTHILCSCSVLVDTDYKKSRDAAVNIVHSNLAFKFEFKAEHKL